MEVACRAAPRCRNRLRSRRPRSSGSRCTGTARRRWRRAHWRDRSRGRRRSPLPTPSACRVCRSRIAPPDARERPCWSRAPHCVPSASPSTGHDAATRHLPRGNQASIAGFAIHKDRAASAITLTTPVLRAELPQPRAQVVKKALGLVSPATAAACRSIRRHRHRTASALLSYARAGNRNRDVIQQIRHERPPRCNGLRRA